MTGVDLPGTTAVEVDASHGNLEVVTADLDCVAERLTADVAVLAPPQAKRLESDTVIALDLDASPTGAGPATCSRAFLRDAAPRACPNAATRPAVVPPAQLPEVTPLAPSDA